MIILQLPGHVTNQIFLFLISAQHCLNNQNSFSLPSGTLILSLIPHLSLLPLSILLYWFSHDLSIFVTPSFCQSLSLVFTALSVSPKLILSFLCSVGKRLSSFVFFPLFLPFALQSCRNCQLTVKCLNLRGALLKY